MGVHAAQLTEIGELVRPRDVTDCWKDGVLHDRSQQHVRAESGGTLVGFLHERCRRVILVADDEAAVFLADSAAPAVTMIEMEQREAVVLLVHL